MKANVLGIEYIIEYKSPEEDNMLLDCDGYCDKSTKRIVITTHNDELGDFKRYQNKCLRHELVHTFMCESGLQNNWQHISWGQEELTVDWIAIQFPKMLQVFKDCNCI